MDKFKCVLDKKKIASRQKTNQIKYVAIWVAKQPKDWEWAQMLGLSGLCKGSKLKVLNFNVTLGWEWSFVVIV